MNKRHQNDGNYLQWKIRDGGKVRRGGVDLGLKKMSNARWWVKNQLSNFLPRARWRIRLDSLFSSIFGLFWNSKTHSSLQLFQGNYLLTKFHRTKIHLSDWIRHVLFISNGYPHRYLELEWQHSPAKKNFWTITLHFLSWYYNKNTWELQYCPK